MVSSQDSSDPYFSETCQSETEKLNSVCASKVTPKLNLVWSSLASKHCAHLLMNTPKPTFKVTADTMVDTKFSVVSQVSVSHSPRKGTGKQY